MVAGSNADLELKLAKRGRHRRAFGNLGKQHLGNLGKEHLGKEHLTNCTWPEPNLSAVTID